MSLSYVAEVHFPDDTFVSLSEWSDGVVSEEPRSGLKYRVRLGMVGTIEAGRTVASGALVLVLTVSQVEDGYVLDEVQFPVDRRGGTDLVAEVERWEAQGDADAQVREAGF